MACISWHTPSNNQAPACSNNKRYRANTTTHPMLAVPMQKVVMGADKAIIHILHCGYPAAELSESFLLLNPRNPHK